MKKHYFYLSTFRLLAALFVLICHARCQLFVTYSDLNNDSQNFFTQAFFAGVGWTSEALAIFFVLSGFLVGGPQLHTLFSVIHGNDREFQCLNILRKFSIGRIVRIIIPLFFAILFVAGVKTIGGVDVDWLDALLNLFGLQGVLAHDFGDVFWTLAYEIWFYVLLAGIICVCCGTKRMVIGLILVLLSLMVFIKLPTCWFFMFLLGIGFYFLKDFDFPRYLMWICLLGVFIVKALGILSMESNVIKSPFPGLINSGMLNLSLALCIGVIMTMLVNKEPISRFACLVERVGNKYCISTYCLYITHMTVLELFKHIFGQMREINTVSLFIYGLMCTLCLIFGYGFYWVFEHKLGDYLKRVWLQRSE